MLPGSETGKRLWVRSQSVSRLKPLARCRQLLGPKAAFIFEGAYTYVLGLVPGSNQPFVSGALEAKLAGLELELMLPFGTAAPLRYLAKSPVTLGTIIELSERYDGIAAEKTALALVVSSGFL